MLASTVSRPPLGISVEGVDGEIHEHLRQSPGGRSTLTDPPGGVVSVEASLIAGDATPGGPADAESAAPQMDPARDRWSLPEPSTREVSAAPCSAAIANVDGARRSGVARRRHGATRSCRG